MESKILGGGEGFVQFSYFMNIHSLFKMVFDCLLVVVDVFEVVVGGFRWL